MKIIGPLIKSWTYELYGRVRYNGKLITHSVHIKIISLYLQWQIVPVIKSFDVPVLKDGQNIIHQKININNFFGHNINWLSMLRM